MRYLSRVRHADTSLLSTSLKAIPSTSGRLNKSTSPLTFSLSLPVPLSRYSSLNFNEEGFDLPCDTSCNTVNSVGFSSEQGRSGSFLTNPMCPSIGYPPMMSIDGKQAFKGTYTSIRGAEDSII